MRYIHSSLYSENYRISVMQLIFNTLYQTFRIVEIVWRRLVVVLIDIFYAHKIPFIFTAVYCTAKQRIWVRPSVSHLTPRNTLSILSGSLNVLIQFASKHNKIIVATIFKCISIIYCNVQCMLRSLFVCISFKCILYYRV